MDRKLIFAVVLILELGGVFSFYISQVNKESDDYEVKEDETTHTLTITSPKSEKPVLREIVYYHIIEKPYEQVTKHNITNNSNNSTNITDKHQILNKITDEKSKKNAINSINSNNDDIRQNNDHINTENKDTIEISYEPEITENTTSNYNVINVLKREIADNTITGFYNIKDEKYTSLDQKAADNLINIAYSTSQKDLEDNSSDSNTLSEQQYNNVNIEKRIKRDATQGKENDTDIENDFRTVGTIFDNYDISQQLIVDNEPFIIIVGDNEDDARVDDDNKYEMGDGNNIEKKFRTTENLTDKYDMNKQLTVDNEPFIIIVADDSEDDASIDEDANNKTGDDIDTEFKKDFTATENLTENYYNINQKLTVDNEPFIIIVTDDNEDDTSIDENYKYRTDVNNIEFTENGKATVNLSNNYDMNKQLAIDKDPFIEIADDNKFDVSIDNEDKYEKGNNNKKESAENIAAKDTENITGNDNSNINSKDDLVNDYKYKKENNKNIVTKDTNINSENDSIIDDIKNYKFTLDVANDYDDPDDGNEGVEFNNRHFTNGHGFQYFYPNPESQDNEDIRRRKREINTLLSVNEEYAPEDLLQNVMYKASERIRRSLDREGTYGMTLTGKTGVVWNDFNDEAQYYDNGESQNKNRVPRKLSKDDELINKKIEAFHDFLNEKPSIDGSKVEPFKEDSKPSTEKPRTLNKTRSKPIAEKSSTKKPKVVKVTTETPSVTESVVKPKSEQANVDKTSDLDKTFGMRLAGDQGMVWSDSNGNTASHHVGSAITSDTGKDRAKIKKKKTPNKNEKSRLEEQSTNPKTEKPKIEAFTEEAIIKKPNREEPKTNRPIVIGPTNEKPANKAPTVKTPNIEKQDDQMKTYGMSLTGGEGVVWNDLNGDRVSYQLGTPSNNKEGNNYDVGINSYSDFQSPSTPIEDNENYSENDLLDDLEDVITELQNILTEFTENTEESDETGMVDITPPNNEKAKLDESSAHPVTKVPKFEALTDEPIIRKRNPEEPKTNRPITGPNKEKPATKEPTVETPKVEKQNDQIKTYGMSLTGGEGIVWNDLNGDRISYHVGKPDYDNQETNQDGGISYTSDLEGTSTPTGVESKNDTYNDLLNDIEEVIKELQNILAAFTENPVVSKNDIDSNKYDTIADIVKEVLENKTANFENKINELIENEVTKQLEEYVATHNETKPSNSHGDENIQIDGKNEENVNPKISKKKDDCDEKKKKKEQPNKIVAHNIYGNSVGNDNVTNIFVFNINDGSSTIPEIDTKPSSNGTDINVTETENEKPTENVSIDISSEKSEATDEIALSPSTEQDKDSNNTIEHFAEELKSIPEKESYENLENPDNEPEKLNNIPTEDLSDKLENSSKELNDTKSSELSDISNEHDKIPNKESNTLSGENGISKEEYDVVPKPEDNSEELNDITGNESIENLGDPNNVSEELNSIPKDESKSVSEELDDVSVETSDVPKQSNSDSELNDLSNELNKISEEMDLSEELNSISKEENEVSKKDESRDTSDEPSEISKEPITNPESSNVSDEIINISKEDSENNSSEPKDISKEESDDAAELNDISKEKSNETLKPNENTEDLNDITKDSNGVSDVDDNSELNDMSDKLKDISNKLQDIKEEFENTRNEPDTISEPETKESEENEVQIDVRNGLPSSSAEA